MMAKKNGIVFILLFTACLSLHAQPVNEKEYLQQGQELEQAGNIGQALDLWEKALTNLQKPSLEIGRQYIRLATEYKKTSRYETAAAMYRWGMSGRDVKNNSGSFKKEIAMLKPIVGKGTYDSWIQLLEKRNLKLYEEIRLFWKQIDPTPATSYNERIIEHWERIAYAREHFTKNRESVYGTDQRGTSWVRYGAPDRIHSGKLRLSSTKASMVIEMLDPKLANVQKQALRNAVLMLHNEPDYIIWLYEEILESGTGNRVHLFGDAPSGGFERLETVSDFIPSRAFSFSSRYKDSRLMSMSDDRKDSRVSPGMVLQYIYYEQLATIGGSFASVFDRISSDWEGDSRQGQNQALNISEGPTTMLQARTEALQNEQNAPVQQSTYGEVLPKIPVEAYQYRMLNEKGRPVFLTFLESEPQQVLVNDLAANEDSMFTSKYVSQSKTFQYYKLFHGLQVRNSEGQIISQSRIPSNIVLDSTNSKNSSSVFTVPMLPDNASVLMYAELHNTHPKSSPRVDTPFPKSLRGKGDVMLEQREPLTPNSSKLQMGDIVLGYQMQRESGGGFLPFVVANDKKISEYENLAVHVEVYHLETDSAGTGQFQLSYQILPRDSAKWSDAREREFSLTLNMETTQSRFSENLEIKASELLPGNYVLRMTATEHETGREVSREIEFEVVELNR